MTGEEEGIKKVEINAESSSDTVVDLVEQTQPSVVEGSKVETAPEEKQEMKDLRAHIESVRAEIALAQRLFEAAKKQVDAHIEAFPHPAAMTDEQRNLEFALLSPEQNTSIKELFEKVKTIDFGLNGKMGELTKKAYPNPDDGSKLSKEFNELYLICEHDLGAPARFLKLHEVIYASKMKTYIGAEQKEPRSGDLGSVRRHFEGFKIAWERGKLLEDDLITRLPSKDKIEEKEIEVASLEHVFDVFEKTFEDEYKKASHKKRFECKIEPSEKKAQVRLNQGALYFILRNIALNALHKKYIDADAGKISARTEDDGGKKYVVVEIKDEGVGIEPDKRTKIFEPGETGAANSSEGVGMGLAYTDKRLRSMGMDITVNSDREKSLEEDGEIKKKYGSTFTVRIPVVEQVEQVA